MIDKQTLQASIESIVLLCKKVNRAKFGSPEYSKANRTLWDTVRDLDALAKTDGETVSPGRFVKFPVGPGYARYIVVKVGAKVCKLAHLPWAEAFKLNEESEGPTRQIEDDLAFEERLEGLFAVDAMPMPMAANVMIGMEQPEPFRRFYV